MAGYISKNKADWLFQEIFCDEEYCGGSCYKCGKEAQYRNKLLQEPDADVQPINQWISCKDKMPEDNTSVLFVCVSENGVKSVHYGYHTTISGIYCGWSKTSGGWQYSDEDVTHWQPLPKPPVND